MTHYTAAWDLRSSYSYAKQSRRATGGMWGVRRPGGHGGEEKAMLIGLGSLLDGGIQRRRLAQSARHLRCQSSPATAYLAGATG
ncbi:hypothetical protein CDV31_017341 [Fusarium ambrosium]|uniref:Uncharacterized protein n=1 Tax=Fusarium ambrosium TaxID=131363 RepID=A0A428RI35_9HYPO|nr:hypothetical protein CDV31_017341 [Fusarium ambrosium]